MSKHQRFFVFVIIAIALLIRSGWLMRNSAAFTADPDAYRQLAETWVSQGIFGFPAGAGPVKPTAYRPPGYPWVLTWLVGADGSLNLSAVALLHLFLGIATTLGVLWLIRLSQPAQRSSVWTLSIAVILVACDPILLVQSTQVMTETLATFLAVATLIAWAFAMRATRDPSPAHTLLVRTIVSGLFVGMTLAAGYLVRPVSIVWTALLSAYVALWLVQSLLARKNLQASLAPPIRFTMINWTCACLVVLTTVGLWTMRNQRSLGQPIWATTHGGYTLLLANNPPLYNHLRSPGWPTFWEPDLFFAGWAAREAGDLTNESFWQSPPVPMPITADELTDDRVAGQAAKATIARDPAMFTYSCLVRLYWLWSPTPQQGPTLQRIAVTAWYLLVYGLVVCSIWKHRGSWFRPQWIAGWMLVVALSVTHAVYWSNLRMRAPAMPFIAIVAAYAFTSRKNLANM